MSEEQQNNKIETPTDIVPPPISETPTVPPVENIINDTSQIPEAKPTETEKEQVNKEPVQVIVNIPNDENKAATTANKIAIIGTIINLALAGLTYMLFQKTIEANKTSQYSLVEAQKAVEQAKRANDIAESNFKLAQLSSESSDSINNINLGLTKKSIEAQVVSINESQKQFQKGNEPYLQYRINATYFDDKKTLVFTPSVLNYGKYPAIITDYNILIATEEYDDIQFQKKCTKFSKQNNLVSIDNPWIISTTKIVEPYYSHSKSHPLFIRGKIIYKNLMTNKTMIYSFKIKYVATDAMYYYDRQVKAF
jgi:hypothetical protein